MKHFFRLSALLLMWCHGLMAQDYSHKLQWTENRQIGLADTTVSLPFFEGNYDIGLHNVPLCVVELDMDADSYDVKVIRSSVLHNAGDLLMSEIPEKLTWEQSRNSRGKSYISFTPFFKIEGRVLRVDEVLIKALPQAAKKSLSQTFSSQNAVNSVLASGTWYKVAVAETGIYRITSEDLRQMFGNLEDIDPKTLKVYGNGGGMLPEFNGTPRTDDLIENAIRFTGEEDGQIDEGDEILFFAHGPHPWFHDGTSWRHRYHLYDEQSYYFITHGGKSGKRITAAAPIDEEAAQERNYYSDLSFHESELVNVLKSGRQWFGENINASFPRFGMELDLGETVPDSEIELRVRSIAFGDAQLQLQVGGNPVGELIYRGESWSTQERVFRTPADGQTELALELVNYARPTVNSFVDYIELHSQRILDASRGSFVWRPDEQLLPGVVQYSIKDANTQSEIWNVSNIAQVDFIKPEDSQFKIAYSGTSDLYVAFDPEDLMDVELMGPVSNQNLHALNKVDYLIVATEELRGEAERLASFHRLNSGLKVEVVSPLQIYNEFSSGAQDIVAIRDLLRRLYNEGSGSLKYFLAFGNGSYDYKGIWEKNGNLVPTYQSLESLYRGTSGTFASDDFYGLLQPDNGDRLGSGYTIDIGIGRLPITNREQAKAMVDKIYTYHEQEHTGIWQNRMVFVSDDYDNRNELEELQINSNETADALWARYPFMNLRKIYCDFYPIQQNAGGNRFPAVNEAIDQSIAQGSLFINYLGHGGVNGWAAERILDTRQIEDWNNHGRYPLISTITCEFTHYDDPAVFSAGEQAVLKSEAGAIGIISTVREIGIYFGGNATPLLVDELFRLQDNSFRRLGDVMKSFKNHPSNFSFQKARVLLFADPAMKLALPQAGMNVDQVYKNCTSADTACQEGWAPTDTLQALSKARVEGSYEGSSSQDARMEVVVYDKKKRVRTRNNKDLDLSEAEMPFTIQENIVYAGVVSGQQGKFNFEFVVPKDIDYTYDSLKMSFKGSLVGQSFAGLHNKTLLGGIDAQAETDDRGPQIELFMNDEQFVSGGITNSEPLLLAKVFDDNGVNMTGNGIGHDIVLVLDNDDQNPIVLNDFYSADKDDFRSGSIRYQLPEQLAGFHSLSLKVWDTYNNSNTAFLDWTVADDSDLELDHVLNYPNPFTTYTEFQFEHNKPNEMLDVLLQVFTVSGKLVKTIRHSSTADGYRVAGIPWDGLDDFGDKLGKGVYVYKLDVRTSGGQSAQKFEKLVLLR